MPLISPESVQMRVKKAPLPCVAAQLSRVTAVSYFVPADTSNKAPDKKRKTQQRKIQKSQELFCYIYLLTFLASGVAMKLFVLTGSGTFSDRYKISLAGLAHAWSCWHRATFETGWQ